MKWHLSSPVGLFDNYFLTTYSLWLVNSKNLGEIWRILPFLLVLISYTVGGKVTIKSLLYIPNEYSY